MKIEIKVPQAGESVTEAMISEWFKADGESVEKDDAILELETDKANMELNAEESGILIIEMEAGEVVTVGQVVGYIDTSGGEKKKAKKTSDASTSEGEAPEPASEPAKNREELPPSPAARKIIAEKGLDAERIVGSGKDGRITKEDAQKAVPKDKPPLQPKPQVSRQPHPAKAEVAAIQRYPRFEVSREERVVPMSMMRRRIAQRLVEAQRSAAILTTFNEVDMSAVMALRKQHGVAFEKKYGVRLGFMSFFVKTCVEALKHVPEINATIEDTNIRFRDYFDIGVAVGSDKGLLVPVIRDCGQLGFAEIELAILEYAQKARGGTISLADLSGGTFTISNGGIYGSLLSTPILNPPQSGILGMHKIEKRPVVVDDQVVVRPMMYLALSYDHRIVDGKGAVTFLVKVKECLEDPTRMLLEL